METSESVTETKNGTSFRDLLDFFKSLEKENAELVAPLTDDPTLRQGAVAWQAMRVKTNWDAVCPDGLALIEKWEWLWENAECDLMLFGVIANVQVHQAKNLFIRLKGLKLIYPDGTINDLAKNFLRAIVLAKLKKNK